MNNERQALMVRSPQGEYLAATSEEVIEAARHLIQAQYRAGKIIAAPRDAEGLLQMKLGALEHEAFAVIYLDTRNAIITYDEMFRGTLGKSAVYPREVVKAALKHNAAAVILAHNHPTGATEPSRADIDITHRIRDALDLVDVRVLDHIIVGADCTSMASMGLI